MATEKIQGYEFAINMDDGGMTRTLREIKNEAKLLKSGMQANFAEIRSGEGIMAAYAGKVKDAGRAIEAQRLVIERLKSEQNGLDQTTQKGREAYVKYENQINAAKRSIASLEGQQERAQKSLDLQKSGVLQLKDAMEAQNKISANYIAKLKAEGKEDEALASQKDSLKDKIKSLKALYESESHQLIKMSEDSKVTAESYQQQKIRVSELTAELAKSKSELNSLNSPEQAHLKNMENLRGQSKLIEGSMAALVSRFKAEGNELEANKAKSNGLREAYDNLNKQLKAENEELNRIKSVSGESSNAYKQQSIRVNELGTKIAQTRTKMKKLDEQLSKKPQSGLTSVISQLNRVNEHADKANHLFGKILGAHLVANGITSAFQSITSHIHEAISAGMEYEKEQQKMTATWLTLTGTVGKSNAMVKTINDLSVKTGQAVDVVNELEQGFYHLHSNKKESDELTKSMLNMSDAVGLDSQQIQAVTQDMVNGLSRGKANAGMLNQISQYFPMFREQLAKYETQVNHGKKVTVADLAAMAKAGKISATDIEKTFNSLGSGKYDKAADNMLHTMVGMERTIKARVPALIGDIEKPILTAQNPIYGAVSKWVSDKRTDKEFNKVGVAAEKGISTITKAFAKAFDVKSAPKAMNDAMDNLAKGVTKASDSIAKNAPEIVNFFKTVKNLGGLGFETLIESLKITNAILKPLLSMVGGHTETIAKFGAAWWLTSKAVKETSSVLSTFKKISDTVSWAEKVLGIKQETKALEEQNAVLKTNAELSTASEENIGTGYRRVKGRKAGNTGADLSSISVEAENTEKIAKSSKWSLLGGTIGTRIINGAGLAMTAWDAGSSIAKAVSSGKASDKYKATGKTAGTLIGGGIGAALGSVIPGAGTAAGAMLGASIGDGVGGTKTANTIVKRISDALKGKSIEAPKIKTESTKRSLSDLGKAYSSYYSKKQKQDLNDVNVLHKAGMLTDAEYKKQLASIKKNDSETNRFEKMSASDRNAIAKYYAQQKASIISKWNARERKTSSSWDAKIASDERQFGANSIIVQKDMSKKKAAIQAEENKKSAALDKLRIKSATETTAQEARLHTTLTGKIKSAANKQNDILRNLAKSKGKITREQANDAISQSNKEYKKTVSLANQEYKDRVSAAEKQHNKVIKAAERQASEAISQAKSQYSKTVDAAKNQYSGNSKYAEKQRAAIISKAKDQKQKSIDNALEQENKTEQHADRQYKHTTDDADKQRSQVVKHAKDQNSSVVDQAKSQSKGVLGHAVKQANGSMKAADKQGSGIHSIWKNITSFFSNLVKGFGIKPINVGAYPSGYTPVTMGAYASGGIVDTARALVGEGGVEAKIDRDNGKVSFLGMNGAEVVNVKPGDQILNAGDTAKLFNGGLGHTLPGYAKGTVDIASFLKKIKSGATSIFDSVSDKAMDALSKITHPLKTLKSMALKTFDPTKTPGVGSIGHDLGKGLVDRALKEFAKAISDLADNFGGAGGSVGNPAGSSVSRWKPYVVRALKANGFGATASQVSAWMRVIARESNGNPRAINLWDSNAKKGIPSMGLVQTIRPTFEAYKFSGHGQIYNGYDDLLAGINYMKHIYGKGDSAFARVSGPEGYANGGFGNKAGVYKLFEGNLPEAIVPMDLSKRSRAYQIMQQIMAKFGAQDGANVINTGNDQIDSDEAFKQRVIASLDALVTGQGDVKAVVANSDVVNAVKSNTKKTSQYSQMMGY
ncbi:tape measure protein [Lactiplantibacillus plantarum]|uniref:tape measure protein n=1 Tax=Lactiplantibacillus plantarum TaxID=1590 RepID=UPI00099F8240|nr:tape measure protein [Lactiplantibacillus plantarum]AQX93763.1 phage tail protein [Lactiplantibacillus plantarum]AWL14614.1 phage tail protein [Lactiplantibacillus plantarum]AYA81538.1 phage tail protein [Lactiplantibacillus plantarum]AYC68014.1 phage tail protein [Lactiplantibacillus plantarum]AYC74427.1 phage tail protein [Lactiplantibacillus plantarum]